MKKIILIIFTLTSILSFSQTTDVITGLNSPDKLLLDGNDLYYTESGSGTISKIDITDGNPTPMLIAEGIGTCIGLAKDGDVLYFSQFDNGRISKIDLTDPLLEIVDVKTNLNTPSGLALDGNDLYFSDINNPSVEKMDITLDDPPLELVAFSTINFRPLGIHLIENILYMAHPLPNRISKVDITSGVTTPEDVVTGSPASAMTSVNNLLYIAEANDDKITTKDLTTSNPSVSIDFLTGLSTPRDVASNSTTLFICEDGANKISKFELVLGINTVNEKQIVVFPNPTNGNITIDLGYVYSKVNTITTNTLGQVIASERFENTDTLDLSIATAAGIYFVNVTTSEGFLETIKVIKK